ncbi:hypothetical protein BGX27_008368 [Mortierella sp. AM989]|nr:hypothetical protein BGX27_008368 [Mortierella sp. AM989]
MSVDLVNKRCTLGILEDQNPTSSCSHKRVEEGRNFAQSTTGRNCPEVPLAHETQLMVAVMDPEKNQTIRTPNGYLIANNYKIKDVWSAAYYASSAALPDILQQYGVAGGDKRAIKKFTERGAPLFANMIIDAIRHTDMSNNTHESSEHGVELQNRHVLHRRGIIDDITGWFKDTFGSLACGAFAAIGVGPFGAAAAVFAVTNPDGVGLTDHQMFFARAAMGHVPIGTTIHYGANFAPGFEDARGAAFLKDIYLRTVGNTRDNSPATDLNRIDTSFAATTHLIVHEIWHVRQYESRGFNLAVFAADYLYGYCKAGLSYRNNPFEVEARRVADLINPLLNQYVFFFKIWRLKNLKRILGFPMSRFVTSSTWAPTGETINALNFQSGILEIRIRSKCYRIWSGSDLQVRSAALCNPNTPNRRGTS